jgi:clan AA aspartic protease (TIGR02281 family)
MVEERDNNPAQAVEARENEHNIPPTQEPSLQLQKLFQIAAEANSSPQQPSSAASLPEPDGPHGEPRIATGKQKKLNSVFFNSNKLRYCSECGLPLNGGVECSDCGRRPEKKATSTGSIAIVCGVAALVIFGTVYGISRVNLHKYFPDEKLGNEKMHEARKLFEKEKIAEGLEMCQSAVDCAPNSGTLHYDFSTELEDNDRITEALDHARTAATLCPENPDMQEHYAEMLDRNGDSDQESLAQYQKVIKAFPKKPNPRYWAASCYQRMKKYDEAIASYREFIKRDPDNIDGAWDGIAQCQSEQGKVKEAVATLKQGIKKTPDSSFLYYQLGLMLNKNGDKLRAIRALETSIDLDSDSADETSLLIADIAGSGKNTISIPLERSGNSYTAKCLLNGKANVKLIVDTGAEVVALKPSVARRLGLDIESMTPIAVTSATGEGIGYETRIESIGLDKGKSIGKERWITAAFHDMPEALDADGLLGMSFLNRFTFSIDGEHNILKLERKTRPAKI